MTLDKFSADWQTLLSSEMPNEILLSLNALFPLEMQHLQGKPEKPYEQQIYAETNTPVMTLSQIITGDFHPELDRTVYGVVLMHSLIQGNKDGFPGLSAEAFGDLQHYLYAAIKKDNSSDINLEGGILPLHQIDPSKLEAFTTLLMIHDLGKILDFQTFLANKAKEYNFEIAAADHDDLLFALLKDAPEDVLRETAPSYAALDTSQRRDVLGALVGGVNPGRIFQLEGAPGEFSSVVQDGSIPVNPDFYRAFHTLDMASIRGHLYAAAGEPILNANGKPAQVFWNDFIHKFMPDIFLLAGQVANGEATPVEAYKKVLDGRAEQFGLDADDPVQKAATRLCAMYRGKNVSPADVVTFLHDAEDGSAWKRGFIAELTTSGYETVEGQAAPSITIGYAPDVSQQIEQSGLSGMEAFEVWAVGLNDMFCDVRAEIQNADHASLGLNEQGQGQVTVEVQGLLGQLKDNPRLLSSGHVILELKGERFLASINPMIDCLET